jgi:hypothetical protein
VGTAHNTIRLLIGKQHHEFSSKQFLGALFLAPSMLTLPQAIHQVQPPGRCWRPLGDHSLERARRNPWVILTNRFEVRNRGLIAADSIAPAHVLFISGGVHEGWIPSPLGLILILAGMVLILRELKVRDCSRRVIPVL